MTLSEYIIAYRASHSLSQRQFAVQCGVSNGYISMLENNLNPKTNEPLNPTPRQLKKIAGGMGMTLQELLSKVDNLFIDLSDSFPDNLLPLPDMRKIPLLGTIACGEPILAEENIEDEVDIPEHIHADFALRCKGDSMINARIFDGDIVYIRQQEIVDNGEIAAVLIGDEATLKRVRLFDDHISLEPENPQYRPLVYWGEDLNEIRILGKAAAFTSPVR